MVAGQYVMRGENMSEQLQLFESGAYKEMDYIELVDYMWNLRELTGYLEWEAAQFYTSEHFNQEKWERAYNAVLIMRVFVEERHDELLQQEKNNV